MSTFDRVIGYDPIKNELMQILDILKNPDIYCPLGAKLPKGLLLYGDPGLGKTLMASCFIEESGLPVYTIRRTKGGDEFVNEISETFREAGKNAPSIVFLDDLDKFANEDYNHRDSEEYVAVQSGIDDVKALDVFVIATCNDLRKLPGSLVRSGRFDFKISVCTPGAKDTEKIVKYFLSDKKLSSSIDMNDVLKMINYNSCADLETMINKAAVYAGAARKDFIEMKDLLRVVLGGQYGFDYYEEDEEEDPEDYDDEEEDDEAKKGDCDVEDAFGTEHSAKTDREQLRRVAMHEAGHLVVAEVLEPGSIGLASIMKKKNPEQSECQGFVRKCKDLSRKDHDLLIRLGGKAATELYFPGVDEGSRSDVTDTVRRIESDIDLGVYGINLIRIGFGSSPESSQENNFVLARAEANHALTKARGILIENRAFLEDCAESLLKKGTLLYSDIQKIRSRHTIVSKIA